MPLMPTIFLPTVECEARIDDCAYEKTNNSTLSKMQLPLKFRVKSDTKLVSLYFDTNSDSEIDLKSLEVYYELTGFKVASLKCITSSSHYQFLLKAVDRHVFYNKFKCTAVCIKDKQSFNMNFSFKIPQFTTKSDIHLDFLDSYMPPDSIINLFNHDFKDHPDLKDAERALLQDLQNNNLDRLKALKIAIFVEDLTQQMAFSQFTLLDVKLQKTVKKDLCIKIKNTEMPPNPDQLSLCLIPMKKFNKEKFMINHESECIFSFIDELVIGVDNTTIHVSNRVKFDKKTNKYCDKIDTDRDYAVRFIPNRITHRASLRAIDKIKENELEPFMKNFEEFPVFQRHRIIEGNLQIDDFMWRNANIASNMQQKIAIMNIVNGSAFPFPYCVFGPPGTGKTSCLVECIVQVMTKKPFSKILVTAQSNSACDEIGERLLKCTPNINIFRLYSPSLLKTKEVLNKTLAPLSNLRDLTKDIVPSQEELQHFQVIISTITSTSKLDRAHLHRHFDYIFIDECAATTEPEVLIPILGLGCSNRGVFSNIVLVGDHKQLPPVITSNFAKELGLDVSLMERMMQTERYKANPEYDNRFVTQLLDNYRSHPAILHFSNTEFYESKLRAKNTGYEAMLGTKWRELPNKDFPIIFHCNKSPSGTVGTSSYNDGESYVVKSYVHNLLRFGIGGCKIVESDIGVVTPYKGQGNKLRQMLPAGVEIGTSEYYQGREKLIIIISTVKSKTGIGFLKDERRLNVCLTRAKALLIVVGNPYTLQQSELWKRFVYYCKDNNACKGSTFILKRLKQNKLKPAEPPKEIVQKILKEDVEEKVQQFSEKVDVLSNKFQQLNDKVASDLDIFKYIPRIQDPGVKGNNSKLDFYITSETINELTTSMASLTIDISAQSASLDSHPFWFWTPPPSPTLE